MCVRHVASRLYTTLSIHFLLAQADLLRMYHSLPSVSYQAGYLDPICMVRHTFAMRTHALQYLDNFCFGIASYNIVESRFGIYGQLMVVSHIPTARLRGIAGQLSHDLSQPNSWLLILHAGLYPNRLYGFLFV